MEQSTILAIVAAVFASSGFWSFLLARFQAKDKRREDEDKQIKLNSKMLKGLGHDRIVYLGTKYIARGSITSDEFENLYDYLYVPYRELGGNGTAEKVMEEVKKLHVSDHDTKEVTHRDN